MSRQVSLEGVVSRVVQAGYSMTGVNGTEDPYEVLDLGMTRSLYLSLHLSDLVGVYFWIMSGIWGHARVKLSSNQE